MGVKAFVGKEFSNEFVFFLVGFCCLVLTLGHRKTVARETSGWSGRASFPIRNQMSAEIRKWDIQQGREMAWHGLTQVKSDLRLSDPEMFLNGWDVKEARIRATAPDGSNLSTFAATEDDPEGRDGGESQGWRALYVDDKPLPGALFVSEPYNKGTYSPLSNREFIRLISASLKEAGVSDAVESVGSVFNRRRVFVSVKLPGMEKAEFGGRDFVPFLNFLNSFDKSCPFLANTSNVCIVCNNTFQMNLSEGGCLVKHSKNMPEKLESLPRVIAQAIGAQKEFGNNFLKLHSEDISEDVARFLFVYFLADAKLSTKAYNSTERLVALFRSGAGNKGRTLADAFSAITDFYSHESVTGEDNNREKQFLSSEFGDGARKKTAGMAYLLDCLNTSKRSEYVENGKRLMADYLAKR